MPTIRQFVSDDSGVTALEYGLLMGLLAVSFMLILSSTGDALCGTFDMLSQRMATAIGQQVPTLCR